MSYAIIFISLYYLIRSIALDLPALDDAYHFVEHGDADIPVKAVFACTMDITRYPLLGHVIPYQASPEICSRVQQDLMCALEFPYQDENFRQMCLTADAPSLEKVFAKAGYRAIGYPTEFWEIPSWFMMEAYNYTVAISPKEAYEIFGEDKNKFHDWMEKSGYDYFLPKRYKSRDEVIYPAIVKLGFTPGTDANRVFYVFNKANLDTALALARPGEPILIEEALHTRAEVVIYFIAFRGKLINRMSCRLSYTEDTSVFEKPGTYGRKIPIKCRGIPSFDDKIRPFINHACKMLKINGAAFINIKMRGVDTDELFYGNEEMVRDWRSKRPPNEEFVKIVEMHLRVGGGLQSDPKTFAKFIRAYFLAYYSEHYNQRYYYKSIYATHLKKHTEGEAPEYEPIE